MVDAIKTRFGVRSVKMNGPKGLYINGEPFNEKLIGANRHQDYVHVGNALPNSGQWRDVKKLREAGCNIIRVAHYPMDDAFMMLVMSLGFLLLQLIRGGISLILRMSCLKNDCMKIQGILYVRTEITVL